MGTLRATLKTNAVGCVRCLISQSFQKQRRNAHGRFVERWRKVLATRTTIAPLVATKVNRREFALKSFSVATETVETSGGKIRCVCANRALQCAVVGLAIWLVSIGSTLMRKFRLGKIVPPETINDCLNLSTLTPKAGEIFQQPGSIVPWEKEMRASIHDRIGRPIVPGRYRTERVA